MADAWDDDCGVSAAVAKELRRMKEEIRRRHVFIRRYEGWITKSEVGSTFRLAAEINRLAACAPQSTRLVLLAALVRP
jgi:hypothetical protein